MKCVFMYQTLLRRGMPAYPHKPLKAMPPKVYVSTPSSHGNWIKKIHLAFHDAQPIHSSGRASHQRQACQLYAHPS